MLTQNEQVPDWETVKLQTMIHAVLVRAAVGKPLQSTPVTHICLPTLDVDRLKTGVDRPAYDHGSRPASWWS